MLLSIAQTVEIESYIEEHIPELKCPLCGGELTIPYRAIRISDEKREHSILALRECKECHYVLMFDVTETYDEVNSTSYLDDDDI